MLKGVKIDPGGCLHCQVEIFFLNEKKKFKQKTLKPQTLR
jgi:hypothetical protein